MLTLRGRNEEKVSLCADHLKRELDNGISAAGSFLIAGPAPAPLAMLRGRHRQRLLVHAARKLDVQDVIRDWLGELDWNSKVRVSVDVDPYSFL